MPIYHGDADLMWIQEVEREYERSRGALERLIDDGKLHPVRFEGDRRVFLRRSEVDPLLRRPIQDVPGHNVSAG